MAVFDHYQNLYDNHFGLICCLARVYMGSLSIFLVYFIEIGCISIACKTSKLGIEGIREIKFQIMQVHGSIQYRDLLKLKNGTSVSDDVTSGSH